MTTRALVAMAIAFAVFMAGGAAPARADEPLRLERVVEGSREALRAAPHGGNVICEVGGLPDGATKDDLTATLGGVSVDVLAVEEDGRVRVRMPQQGELAPGRHELRLAHGSRRSNPVVIELMTRDAFRAAFGEASESSLAIDAGRQRWAERLRIERFEIVTDEAGRTRVTIGGAADLPDRARLLVRFLIVGDGDGRAIDQAKVAVEGGRFEHVFGPFTGEPLAAIYRAEASADLAKDALLRRALAGVITEGERRALGEGGEGGEAWKSARLRARELVEHGERARRDAQLATIREHYRDSVAVTHELIDELDLAYGAASRTLFGEGEPAGLDEARWGAHLRAHLLTRRDPATGREDAAWGRRLREDGRFLTDAGRFDPDPWIAWVRAEQLPAVASAAREHRAFVERWIAPLFPVAALKLAHVIDTIGDLSLIRTEHLFAHHRLELPDELASRPGAAPVPRSPQAKAGYVRQGLAEVERIVGARGD